MKVCHYKHPNRVYTVLGTGIISAITSKPLADMDEATVYTDPSHLLFVCQHGDPVREGFTIVNSHARAQSKEPLKIGTRITVYRSDEDGSHWVRSTDEFNDGRFSADTSEMTLLWQARYALRDMHVKFPTCGYNKLADACERAADSVAGFPPRRRA